MKIALIITGLGIGGAERQLCDLADTFLMKDQKVIIISLTGPVIIKPNSNKIPIYEIGMRKTPWGFMRALWEVSGIIKKENIDVLHSHMFHANIFSRSLRLFTKIPKLICTAHSINEGGSLRMFMYRITNWLSDINTNVSQDAVNSFIKKKAMKENQIISISNGIDTNKFIYSDELRERIRRELDIYDNIKLFLSVGRLHDSKDYPNLLYAFSILLKKKPLSYLIIVGNGILIDKLMELANNLNIMKNIRFLGARNDIPALMSSCDTFVLSSKYEGQPLVIAEAMACQRYIVATDSGGVKYVLNNYGSLVPIRNSKKLADAMEKSIEIDRDKKHQLGLDARKHIENNFSIENLSIQWLRLYKKTEYI
ncbi:glycosyltransferase [Xenorhabdus budapestensis]|uniref:glycosyltransferase n=1 Tax=Xenorhabdus budapestensis TaxID=290110 RepID=UPI003A8966D9